FKDIKIDNNKPWKKHHYKSIISCYGKSPWWKEYEEDIEKFYQQKKIFLLDFNYLIYEWVANTLKCKINYISTNSLVKNCNLKNSFPIYQQVFGHRFNKEVFILDAILCLGEKELVYCLQQHKR
ncbi:MAG: WbqC family protein, partial [Chitinophagaceae bacterium]